MAKPKWIPYDPSDPAWAPDESPDKSRSLRWTGAAPGDLVTVSMVGIDRALWLPRVYIGGPAYPGGVPNDYEWLTEVSQRGFFSRHAAKCAATRGYLNQRSYNAHRAQLRAKCAED